MSSGLAFPGVLAAVANEPVVLDEDEAYVRQVAATYGLTSLQQRQLRAVLQRRAEDEREVFRAAAELPPPVAAALEAVRRKASERMRALLDDKQRTAYDRAVLPRGK